MKVYLDVDGKKRLIGRADIPVDAGPIFKVPLFGAASTMMEQFMIGTVTHLQPGMSAPVVEQAVIVSAGQLFELLPGWQPAM